MDEHKENIHAKDVNVKMSNTREDEKVGVSSELTLASYNVCVTVRLNKQSHGGSHVKAW